VTWGVIVFPGSNDDRDTRHVLAEVIGADLTNPLSGEDAKAVEEAFFDHHLLCFRSECLAQIPD